MPGEVGADLTRSQVLMRTNPFQLRNARPIIATDTPTRSPFKTTDVTGMASFCLLNSSDTASAFCARYLHRFDWIKSLVGRVFFWRRIRCEYLVISRRYRGAYLEASQVLFRANRKINDL